MDASLRRTSLRAHAAGLSFAAAFLVQGYAFLRRFGYQEDEALFAAPLFDPRISADVIRVFGVELPLMISSYLGSLKTWLYAVIFNFWDPGVCLVRVPVLLAGCATVYLFFRLLLRTAGFGAAVAGTALLATDTVFLLTTTFDWGPVALQHLLAVSALLLFVRFHQAGKRADLALAGFCCGLGIWDKAAFLWMLTGVAVAALVLFRREVAHSFTFKNALLAGACLWLGASPFWAYSLHHPGAAHVAAGGFSSDKWVAKAYVMGMTLDGSVLFNFLIRADSSAEPRSPETGLERVSLTMAGLSGRPAHNLQRYAVFVVLLLLPVLWKKTDAGRPAAFALLAFLVAWAIMIAIKNGGGGAHHTVLLWPLPHMAIGIALAQAWRWKNRLVPLVAASILAVLCLSNLALTNEYLARAIEKGTAVAWTDAGEPLSAYLSALRSRRIFVLDWGIMGPLRLSGRGRLPVHPNIGVLWARDWSEQDRTWLREDAISPQGNYFVAHVPGTEVVPGVRPRLRSLAAAMGFREQLLMVAHDRNKRPVMEVFRYVAGVQAGGSQ
jgi:hypothetical protein